MKLERELKCRRGQARSGERLHPARKDNKNTVADVYAMIRAPNYKFTLTPQKVGKTADFMYKIGSIKTKPVSRKDPFFPEVQDLPGD